MEYEKAIEDLLKRMKNDEELEKRLRMIGVTEKYLHELNYKLMHFRYIMFSVVENYKQSKGEILWKK